MTLRLPDPCLVVLVGATGAGKSAWAGAWFHADQVVSSDRLRAVVGAGERDQRASRDAFELLDLIVAKRLRRGPHDGGRLDRARAEAPRRLAGAGRARGRAGLRRRPRHAGEGRARAQPGARDAGARQGRRRAAARGRRRRARRSPARASPASTRAGPVELVPPAVPGRPGGGRPPGRAIRCRSSSGSSSRASTGTGTGRDGATLAEVARAAEEAGFTSLWVMDHFLQIPQVGREWEDMLESYTTLGYLAGVTERIRLGTLVTGVTYRNLAHLAKIVATLDVLSGGRALCGLGTAWFEREHRLYGWDFPPLGRALRAARGRARAAAADVGPGRAALRGPHDRGRRGDLLPAAAAGAHPDPRRRLGRAADAAARGAPRRRVQPVRRRRRPCATSSRCCARTARPRAATRPTIAVTHLAPARVVAAGEPREGQGAATVEEHVGRYRELAEAGVQTAIVGLSDARGPGVRDPVRRRHRGVPR